MRIERLHIDRFGILAEQDLPSLSPGLNLFLGRNEAGKSTCLRFFQSMLFGYKRGNRSLDPMPQRGGSLAGGTLELHSDSLGALSLTRRPGAHGGLLTLADQNGRELDESTLQRLFGSLTVDVFDNIFAFSLKNLMEFSSLKGDNVRHALHGAAFGLGLQSPAQVLKMLDDRMSVLLKRDSASAAINNALRELDAVRGEAAARTPDMRQYAELQDRLAVLEERLEALRAERAVKERGLHRVQRRRDMWRHWEEVRRIRSEKTALLHASTEGDGALPVFAPDAVQRLDALLARREEQRLSAWEAEQARVRLEADIAAIPFAPELAPLHREAQALREQKERRRAEAEAYPQLLAGIDQLSALQERALARLGSGWDAPRIAAADCSLAVREQIQRFEKSLPDLEYTFRDKEREQQRLGAELAEALMQEAAAKKNAAPAVASRTPLPDTAVCSDLASDLTRAEQALEDLPGLRERQTRTAEDARLSLTAVSPEWTAADLAAFDDSPPARQRFITPATTVLEAPQKAAQHERPVADAQAAAAHAQTLLSLAEERLKAHEDLPDDSSLDARRELLDEMYRLSMELAAAEREHEAAAEAAGQKQTASNGPESAARKKSRAAALAASPLFVGGGQLVLGGVALMAGGWLGLFSPFLYAGGILALSGLLACLLQRAVPPEESGTLKRNAVLRAAETQALERRNALAEAFKEVCRQAQDWLDGDPHTLPDTQSLTARLRRLEEQARQSTLRERDRQDARAASLSCREAHNRLERAIADREQAETAVRQYHEQWEQALARLNLPAALPPDQAAAAFARRLAVAAQVCEIRALERLRSA